jgi:hypothetical protein
MSYDLMGEYKVENDVYIKKLSKKYCPQFGKIAVDMRFVTAEQLNKALAEQGAENPSNKPHRLIGSILSEHGWITNEQVDIVLDILFKVPA